MTGSLPNEDVLAIGIIVDLRDAEGGGGVVLLEDALVGDDRDDLINFLVEGLEGGQAGFLLGRRPNINGGEIRFYLDLGVPRDFDSVEVTTVLR